MAENEKATAKKAVAPTRKKAAAKAFPFSKDHYISTPSTARRGHSDGAAVRHVQERLGVKVTGVYDAKTREAVLDYQRENDLDISGVVDAEMWDLLNG